MSVYNELSQRMEKLSAITNAEIQKICECKIGESYYKALIDAMKYTLEAGGKGVRSYLVYEFCTAASESDDFIEGCEKYAAAVEMMHTFSLIHDDLPAMDDDKVRRGKAANHIAFGEATAILAGDALALLSLHTIVTNRFMNPLQNCEAAECLSYYAGRDGMIGGQQIDLDGEKVPLTREKLDLMNSMKTGSLIAAACELGCIAGSAHIDRRTAAKGYGFLLGRAFQVIDDILDVEGSSEQLGKQTGTDAKKNKSTYVSMLGVEGSRKLAAELTEKAKDCLSAFNDTSAKARLLNFADFLLERKK